MEMTRYVVILSHCTEILCVEMKSRTHAKVVVLMALDTMRLTITQRKYEAEVRRHVRTAPTEGESYKTLEGLGRPPVKHELDLFEDKLDELLSLFDEEES